MPSYVTTYSTVGNKHRRRIGTDGRKAAEPVTDREKNRKHRVADFHQA